MDAHLVMSSEVYAPSVIEQADVEALVHSHLHLVRRIAQQVYWRVSSSVELEDLVQIGRVALIEAAGSFEDRGYAAFASYATIRIRGAMIDQLRKTAHIVRSAMRRRREFRNVRKMLQGELGRNPNDAEMAARVDMSLDAYRAVVRSDHAIIHESLDDAYSDHDAVFADEAPSAFDNLEAMAKREAVIAAIAALPEREAMVLQLYFVEELSLEAIGQTLGVGAARICQIKKIALDNVRAKLGGWISA